MKTGSHPIKGITILISLLSLLPSLWGLGCSIPLLRNDPEQPKTPTSPRLSLHYSVAKGDINKLRQLIAKGADVNELDSNGLTPLHISSMKGHAPISKVLLDNNAKLNPKDPEGLTPLCWAVLEGQKDVVELLVKRGVNVNTEDNSGETPIEKARQRGYHEIEKILTSHGTKTDEEEPLPLPSPKKEVEKNSEKEGNSSATLSKNTNAPTSSGPLNDSESIPSPENITTPSPIEKMSRSKRFQRIIFLLGNGNAKQAKIELETYIKDYKNSEKASLLLRQINNQPSDLFKTGNEYFEYKVHPNETLSAIAEKFLDNTYLFYALARYNGIDSPNNVKAGQIIKIPGQNSNSAKEVITNNELDQKPQSENKEEKVAKVVEEANEEVWEINLSPKCPQDRKTPKAPPEVYSLENPLEENSDNLAAAKKIYNETASPIKCVLCHGANGNGIGDSYFMGSIPARNFTCSETMNHLPDGQLFWIIKNGSSNTPMPSFSELGDNAIWQLVLFVRHFSK
jgi:LysM repeat protein